MRIELGELLMWAIVAFLVLLVVAMVWFAGWIVTAFLVDWWWVLCSLGVGAYAIKRLQSTTSLGWNLLGGISASIALIMILVGIGGNPVILGGTGFTRGSGDWIAPWVQMEDDAKDASEDARNPDAVEDDLDLVSSDTANGPDQPVAPAALDPTPEDDPTPTRTPSPTATSASQARSPDSPSSVASEVTPSPTPAPTPVPTATPIPVTLSGQIVFESWRSVESRSGTTLSVYDIWAYDPDSDEFTIVWDGLDGNLFQPKLSPDGRYVAAGGDGGWWIISADGTNKFSAQINSISSRQYEFGWVNSSSFVTSSCCGYGSYYLEGHSIVDGVVSERHTLWPSSGRYEFKLDKVRPIREAGGAIYFFSNYRGLDELGLAYASQGLLRTSVVPSNDEPELLCGPETELECRGLIDVSSDGEFAVVWTTHTSDPPHTILHRIDLTGDKPELSSMIADIELDLQRGAISPDNSQIIFDSGPGCVVLDIATGTLVETPSLQGLRCDKPDW